MSALVLRGDARTLPLPDASVDLVVTSPPFYALRSYTDTPELCDRCRELIGEGWEYPRAGDTGRNLREAWPDWEAHVAAEHKPTHYHGQIGSEATPQEYIANLIDCTREWMRVLKPGGSIWVNLGDKYAGVGGSNGHGWCIESDSTRERRAKVRVPLHQGRTGMAPAKSLMLLPERYRIACVDQLGLIARAVVVWSKPNGLPESVTDRVRRSHEDWVHLVRMPRYFSAVDEIREEHSPVSVARSGRNRFAIDRSQEGIGSPNTVSPAQACNPLGKLPGSVWEIATEPLTVPDRLGVDHFAAFPTEWPRRIIMGWSPSGICTVCGEGRRPVADRSEKFQRRPRGAGRFGSFETQGGPGGARHDIGDFETVHRIIGEACACPDTTASTRPAVVLDPFGGTGTTALVAKALGRVGITVDRSADYCRLAQWRTTDRGQLAKAMRVEKPPVQVDGQLDLFGGAA